MMIVKSITTPHLTFILSFLLLSPYPSQQLEYDDQYLFNRELNRGTRTAIERRFAQLTEKMNAQPRDYAEATLFPHFYLQLAACTGPTTRNTRELKLTAACDNLLTFLWDLGLLPAQYRRNSWAPNPAERWLNLERDWLHFYRRHSSTGAGDAAELEAVDHPVEVPQQYLPLLNDPVHLRLAVASGGTGDATTATTTVSYLSLMKEFLRYQAVYATKKPSNRKQSAFQGGTQASINRLLKLRVIFLLMMGEQWLDSQANLQMLANVAAAAATLPVRAGPSRRGHPLEEDDEEEDNHNRVGKLFKEDGDSKMRSMNKEGSKNQLLKKASALVANRSFGLVTLLTLGFIAVTIALIWALYSIFGSNFFQQKEQEEEKTTSATTKTSENSI